MNNIKRVPLFVLIIVFLAAGNISIAQEKENRSKESKEMNKAAEQEKQKGKEKVREAEEAVEAEAAQAGEAAEEEAEKAGEASEDKAEKVKDAAGEGKQPKEMKEMQEKEGDKGQGHAYGRNKGGLTGREFGQARAEEARMQQQLKEAELDDQLAKGEEKVAQSRERIRVAREELEKEKTGRRISDKDYQMKKEKIDKAEEAVNEYEQQVRNGRSLKSDK
ncbi:hypothetical protein EG827_06460 [bacterium]|nr:hypothetical protein [bacterium]